MEDTNNLLQARCMKLVNTKQTLHNKDKELVIIKVYNLKLQIDNKYLVAKIVETNKVIKFFEALQYEYNELN